MTYKNIKRPAGHAKLKNKILVISTNDSLSGAPLYVKSVIHGLRHTFDFSVVFGESGPIGKDLSAIDIPVCVIEEMKSNISPVCDLISIGKLLKLIRGINPDIIYAHSSKAGMLARIITLLTGVPTIYTVHGWGWRGMGLVKKYTVVAVEKLLSYIPSTYFIYVAEAVKAEGASFFKVKPDRGLVIRNGAQDFFVMDRSLTEANTPIKMMMVARVAAAKDHETLLRAFEISGYNTELWLCGEGTDTKEFMSFAKLWAPTYFHSIKFLGDRGDIRSLLAKVDIFLLISNYEALPLSVIEAMGAGMAIIATEIGGIPELISNGINGVLVKKGDVQGLSAAISKFKDKNVRNLCGAKAREIYIEKFTLSDLILQVKNYLIKICEENAI